jgi:hypothetical protein
LQTVRSQRSSTQHNTVALRRGAKESSKKHLTLLNSDSATTRRNAAGNKMIETITATSNRATRLEGACEPHVSSSPDAKTSTSAEGNNSSKLPKKDEVSAGSERVGS